MYADFDPNDRIPLADLASVNPSLYTQIQTAAKTVLYQQQAAAKAGGVPVSAVAGDLSAFNKRKHIQAFVGERPIQLEEEKVNALATKLNDWGTNDGGPLVKALKPPSMTVSTRLQEMIDSLSGTVPLPPLMKNPVPLSLIEEREKMLPNQHVPGAALGAVPMAELEPKKKAKIPIPRFRYCMYCMVKR